MIVAIVVANISFYTALLSKHCYDQLMFIIVLKSSVCIYRVVTK